MTSQWRAVAFIGRDAHAVGIRALSVCVLTTLFTLSMVSLTAAKHEDGGETSGFRFEYVTVTLLQEGAKFCVALYLFRRESTPEGFTAAFAPIADTTLIANELSMGCSSVKRQTNVFRTWEFLAYGIPGLLYCVDTNFQYIILTFLEPTELAIVWNFKVFATASLLRLFLNKRYTNWQWMALGLLLLGCAMTQAADQKTVHQVPKQDGVASVAHQAADASPDIESPSKFVGTGLAILGSTVAASSNVFCEWLVKNRPDDSIHFQNMQLYVFGIAMNLVALVVKMSSEPNSPVNSESGFFTGYTVWVWATVLLGSASGMVISFTLKFVDNIAVIFAHAIAVIIASTLTSVFFGVELSLPFVAGGGLVLSALALFHSGEERPQSTGRGELKPIFQRPMYCLDESQ